MKINLEIPNDRIANLMVSAIESGDPVTRAWCVGIEPSGLAIREAAKYKHWYAEAEFYARNFSFLVKEVLDESKEAAGGNIKKHQVTKNKMSKGLAVMAKVFPHQFAMILKDDTDAPCADALLQSICFGEEKYA